MGFQQEMSLEVERVRSSSKDDREPQDTAVEQPGTGALFMAGTAAVPFAILAHQCRYHWVAQSLKQFGYTRLRRAERGLIVRFLCKVTTYSRGKRPASNLLTTASARLQALISSVNSPLVHARSMAAMSVKPPRRAPGCETDAVPGSA